MVETRNPWRWLTGCTKTPPHADSTHQPSTDAGGPPNDPYNRLWVAPRPHAISRVLSAATRLVGPSPGLDLVHPGKDGSGQLQGPTPVPPRHDRRRSIPNRLDQGLELAKEGVLIDLVASARLFSRDLRLTPLPLLETGHLGLAPRKIDGNVRSGRKYPELAHLVAGDPAGGGVGDQPRGKPDPGVGDVDPGGQDRHPDRIDLDRLRAVEGEDDVEVVDHQVQHDVDVEAAGRERAQAMHLDEARLRDRGQEDVGGRIEALDVPDLEQGSPLLRQRDQVVRFLEGRGHGLLDQDVPVR